jgi:hypothetical protein
VSRAADARCLPGSPGISAWAGGIACTLGDNGAFQLRNRCGYAVTAVIFTPSAGGTADTRTYTIADGENQWLSLIDPGTYDISVTVEGVGTFVAWNDYLIEDDHLYTETLEDSDLP